MYPGGNTLVQMVAFGEPGWELGFFPSQCRAFDVFGLCLPCACIKVDTINLWKFI